MLEDLSLEADEVKQVVPDLICERCSKIDFDYTYSQAADSLLSPWLSQEVVQNLGPMKDWASNSCPLCKALANMVANASNREQTDSLSLKSLHSEESPLILNAHPLLQNITPRVVLQVESSLPVHQRTREYAHEFLVPQLDASSPIRRIKQDSIDFSILRNWIGLCEEMHTKNCSYQTSHHVRYLKFLDCETRQLVPAENRRYVTLSYMWGKGEKPPIYSDQLGNDLPSTIEDAITVTLKLGLRYLWIDRYCIHQQRKEEAMYQIQSMDLIYSNSYATIVAAAGEGPTYGLPGVGTRHRLEQPFCKIGKHFLLSPGVVAPRYVDQSRWASRGWTYQEAMLSRRRIIFTDDQVYYECNGMYCYESFSLPWKEMHAPDGQTLRDEYVKPNMTRTCKIVVFPGGVGNVPLNVYDRITEYSTRELTYQSDKLNGILGVLKAFENGPHKIRHLWGTPIMPDELLLVRAPNGIGKWTPDGLVKSMCWLEPEKRLKNFPSWSWTGWEGKVDFTFMGSLFGLQQNPKLEVDVETNNGNVLSWEEYHQFYAEINSPLDLSHFIHISAWSIPIAITRRNGRRRCANIAMKDGCYFSWQFEVYQDDHLLGDTCDGLLITENRDSNVGRMVFILVVDEVDGRLERVSGAGLPFQIKFYTADGKKATGEEKYVTWDLLVERYGENWYQELVSSYKTFRVG